MGNPLNHKARKRFGQHFLQDQAVIHRIVNSLTLLPGERCVEIGPGRGAITGALLQATGRLDVIELDRDLIEPLRKRYADLGELNIYDCDALQFDFNLLGDAATPIRIVGNLPYNISTPLLFHLLEQSQCTRDMHFLLQREVVERMAASPGSKRYGRLSVMLQIQCEVTPLFNIAPTAFSPAPKVDSTFVRLVPFTELPFQVKDSSFFKKMVTQAFSLRRKILRNSLGALIDTSQMEMIGVDPGVRAEQLAPRDFVNLANIACNNTK